MDRNNRKVRAYKAYQLLPKSQNMFFNWIFCYCLRSIQSKYQWLHRRYVIDNAVSDAVGSNGSRPGEALLQDDTDVWINISPAAELRRNVYARQCEKSCLITMRK